MSENTNPDTRTLLTRDTIKHLAKRCDLYRLIGPLSLVNADEWDCLLTFTHQAIDAAGVEQLMRERDEARAEVERLTAERDTARAEVQRLIAERDQPESRQRGREVGRFGLDGHYLYAMEPARPNGQGILDSWRPDDETIWREAIMTLLPSYPVPKAAEHADGVLAEYRKRWPR